MEKPILSAFLSVKSLTLSDQEKYLFEKYNPVGVVLLNRNASSQEQLSSLIKSIKEAIGRDDVLISLDEEGGRVGSLKGIGLTQCVSQNILGLVDNLNTTSLHGKIISSNMKKVGANFNLAPVLDTDYKKITIALKNRCFGKDKEKITKHGKILCQTYINEGICPCMKHFPGHGKALNDPHAMTPVINCSLQELENDFYPFKNLNNMPAGMTAHIVLPQIDDKNPITISKKGIDYVIRGIIGFNGFLISDALEMHALKGNITDNAIAAWDAGCDAVCYCMGDAAIIESICVNGRYLNDTSLERFKTIKQIISNKKETIVLDKEIKAYYSETSNFTEEPINYDAIKVLNQQ